MLLRLLPSASTSQPTPPTILFTLPMPDRPYTSRSLPLPQNLMVHRSVCLQEDIECANVLLGEKSSWIAGVRHIQPPPRDETDFFAQVIDDVTFSLPQDQISVHLIDGTTLALPLTPACVEQLQRVIQEVQLSFAPKPEAVQRSRMLSAPAIASTSTTSQPPIRPTITIPPPHRRSPSALLLSLLSPILPFNQVQAQQRPSTSTQQQPPARLHRRQARSLLVDTYRRHILPLVKGHLPDAYLPWAIASETSTRLEEFEKLREEINATLATAGVNEAAMAYVTPTRRRRSGSCSSSDSESDSDATPSPVTPATSIFSPSACSTPPRASRAYASPQPFLLSIPPAHVLPPAYRNAYSSQLARLTQIASRLSAIKKLNAKYEREEGKRRWLESLERGRGGDKALRRTFSNGHTLRGVRGVWAEPIKQSKLWRSWTVEDEERAEIKAAQLTHPAMMEMDSIEEVSSLCLESDCGSAFDEEIAPRPFTHLSSSIEEFVTEKVILVRPPLIQAHSDHSTSESEDDTPSLRTNRSDDSLIDVWEAETPMNNILLPPPIITGRWDAAPSPSSPQPKCIEVDWSDHWSLHNEVEEIYA